MNRQGTVWNCPEPKPKPERSNQVPSLMVNTRATNKDILQYDFEIDRTLFTIKKEIRECFKELPFEVVEFMARERSLRELKAPNIEH